MNKPIIGMHQCPGCGKPVAAGGICTCNYIGEVREAEDAQYIAHMERLVYSSDEERDDLQRRLDKAIVALKRIQGMYYLPGQPAIIEDDPVNPHPGQLSRDALIEIDTPQEAHDE